MKNIVLYIISSILLLFSYLTQAQDHQHHQKSETKADTTKKSIPAETHAMVGANHFTIKYYAPAVRGRVIWGGLVAYGQVWVTGAHSATSIEFTQDIKIGNNIVKAGKYAFFTIPNQKSWTVMLNKNWEQHLADEYDQKDDVLRFEVKPKKQKEIAERLVYEVNKKGKDKKAGEIVVRWEKLSIAFEFENQ
jgi:flagellar biosynthesis component FlhA